MGMTVYDGVYAFAKKANSELFIACKTAILNNPENQIYTPKGKSTMIRQYASGNAGSYDKSKAWLGTYGKGDGVKWVEYKAPWDRAKILQVDAMDELQSYVAGMTPSIDLLNQDFLNRVLPREVDACNIATFYSKIPAENKHLNTETNWKTDKDNILQTIIGIENAIFNSGYDGYTALFMDSEAYTNLQTAIIANYGLASGVMMSRKMNVNIDTGIKNESGDSLIEVSTDVQFFNNLILIKMPQDRMYTKITMLDGYSVGQEDGGYIADNTTGFGNIKLMAIPLEAGFTNTRYIVDNYLVPETMMATASNRVDLLKVNEKMFGNVEINHAGINQKANAFEYDIRTIYGGDLFENRRKTCFVVTSTLKA